MPSSEQRHLIRMHGMSPALWEKLCNGKNKKRNAEARRNWHEDAHRGGDFADYLGEFTDEECEHEDRKTFGVDAVVQKNRLYFIPGAKYGVKDDG